MQNGFHFLLIYVIYLSVYYIFIHSVHLIFFYLIMEPIDLYCLSIKKIYISRKKLL